MGGKNIIEMVRVGTCFFVLLCVASLVFIDKAYGDLGPIKNDYGAYLQLVAAFAQAKALQKTGLLTEPIKSFNDALNLARKVEDHKIEIECLMSLGILSWDKGEVSLSSQYYLEALKIAHENGFKQITEFCESVINIHSLFKEAKELRINKDYMRAKDKYSQAISLARKINSVNHEVKCLRQMSSIYFSEFNLRKYLAINRQALALAKSIGIIREEGYCCYNIALYYLRIGYLYESFNLFSKSLETAKILRDLEDEIDCLNNIGFILSELGNYKYSLEIYNKALSLITDGIKKAEILNNIGIYIKLNAANMSDNTNYFNANAYFRKALYIAIKCRNPMVEAIILNNIGISYIALKKHRNALFYLKESMRVGKNESSLDYVSDTLTNIGNIYFEIHNYREAEKYYLKAIKLLGYENVPRVLWGSYYGLGRCFEKIKNFDRAIYYYKKAIALIENVDKNIGLDIEKANYLRNKIIVYESLIKILYIKLINNNNNIELKNELLLYIEKAKAKTLSELFRRNRKTKKNLNLYKNYDNRELIGHVGSAPMGGSSITMLDEYGENENKYYTFSKLINLKGRNNENESIFIYSIGEELSILSVIMNNDIEYYKLPSREKVEISIRAYLKLISSSSNDKYIGKKAAARILNEIFFPVMEKRFKKIKKIIIIPDGLLFYLPFESLVLENTSTNSYSFVIEKYDVSYSPSLSFLYALDQKLLGRKTGDSFLIIGNPDYNSFRMRSDNQYFNAFMNNLERHGFYLDPLPYTKKEALMIKNVIRSKKAMVCLNHEASEDNLKKMDLKKYSIIHFACHGFIDEEAPTRSALVLSNKQGSKQDGFLQVGEIYDLELDADLVVLSACLTGRGQIARGEGILGLTRTFFYSGARSVISTLWSINDISTANFMKHFYLFLSKGMTKSEALRSAKLKMIYSQYSHPFYWAAFILNGDYKSKFDWH